MKNIKLLIIGIMLFAAVDQLSAQTIINNDTIIQNRAYFRIGVDPATLLTFGYDRKFDLSFLMQDIVTYAEWGVSIANIKNSELKIGAILPVFEKRNFKIINNLNISAGQLSAKTFDSKKFAAADEVAFGFYRKASFIAITAEYEKIILNLIEHTDFYRESYYEDAVDGWYKGAGGMIQFGIEGGVTLMKSLDIHLEIKMPFTENFNGYGGSPFHVNLGLGYRF